MIFKEFIKDFLAESREILARLDEDFIAVEKNPGDEECLDSIYGGIHTIKGSAGFFAFSKLEALAHAGESLLSDVTEGKVQIGQTVVSPLLAMVDAIKEMLDCVEKTGGDGENEYPDLTAVLMGLRAPESDGAPEIDWDAAEREVTGQLNMEATSESTGPLEAAPEVEFQPETEAFVAPPVEITEVTAKVSEEAEPKTDSVTPASEIVPPTATNTIRVGVSLLDDLMNLVGELVLSRNQMMQYGALLGDRACLDSLHRLDHITRDLQQATLQTRMQPIRTIFKKFPRIARDLAVSCGKKVIFNVKGEDTELDRSLIEGISAPLTHLLRNAIDHGIEAPEVRLQAGKPADGRVQLSAYHESGHVHIELKDDGAGIDVDKLRAKAVLKGVITDQEAATMGESESLYLMFEQGLSTTEQVSRVSGRGMGMDVVRSSLAGIRGSVDVRTAVGKGTTVRIKVPLTLAIIQALVVSCGNAKFAIPQVHLREVLCLQGEEAAHSIELLYETPVYRLRGQLLPLLYLSAELGLVSSPKASDLPEIGDGQLHIVVLSLDDHHFGLVVESIHNTHEIVVKPIATLAQGQGCFSGAAIMDDGRPALILDILRLAQRARVVANVLDKPMFKVRPEAPEASLPTEALLLFETSEASRMALPVTNISRLEMLPEDNIERAGKRLVIQYRDKVLPLISLQSVLEGTGQDLPEAIDGRLPVVVFDIAGQQVGVLVGRILDIVECVAEPADGPTRRGILGARIILGHSTEIVDLDALMQLADAHLTVLKPHGLREAERHV